MKVPRGDSGWHRNFKLLRGAWCWLRGRLPHPYLLSGWLGAIQGIMAVQRGRDGRHAIPLGLPSVTSGDAVAVT